tara:strand:- start:114636 stop:114953 length:318 start_codon:yes stop_codon:yes gene_type:complete
MRVNSKVTIVTIGDKVVAVGDSSLLENATLNKLRGIQRCVGLMELSDVNELDDPLLLSNKYYFVEITEKRVLDLAAHFKGSEVKATFKNATLEIPASYWNDFENP